MVPPVKNWLVTFHAFEKDAINMSPATVRSWTIMARDEDHADEVAEMLGEALKTETPYYWEHQSSRILEDPAS